MQEGRDSSRKGLHGCFTGEQGLYIYDNGTAGRNAIGQICLLPEISAVLNQSDAVCIPLTAAASSILVSAGRKPPFRAGRKSPILAGRKSPIVIYNLRRFFTLRA